MEPVFSLYYIYEKIDIHRNKKHTWIPTYIHTYILYCIQKKYKLNTEKWQTSGTDGSPGGSKSVTNMNYIFMALYEMTMTVIPVSINPLPEVSQLSQILESSHLLSIEFKYFTIGITDLLCYLYYCMVRISTKNVETS